jgi:hypothetical protein
MLVSRLRCRLLGAIFCVEWETVIVLIGYSGCFLAAVHVRNASLVHLQLLAEQLCT